MKFITYLKAFVFFMQLPSFFKHSVIIAIQSYYLEKKKHQEINPDV